jgi:FlgD Ig-like domain
MQAVAGMAALYVSASGMDVQVEIPQPSSPNSSNTARIRIFQSPGKEPLGAVKLRLKLRPEAGTQSVASLAPATGPWSQFAPQLRRSGDELIVWAMAPNIGASKDSTPQLIADLDLILSPAPAQPMASAANLIDSVIVMEAWTPFGKATTLARNLTTGLRGGKRPAPSAPVEVMRSSLRSLNFTLGKAMRVRAYVADFRGQRVAALCDGKLAAGMHELTWDGRAASGKPLSAGSYFLRLEAGAYVYDRKLEVGR